MESLFNKKLRYPFKLPYIYRSKPLRLKRGHIRIISNQLKLYEN